MRQLVAGLEANLGNNFVYISMYYAQPGILFVAVFVAHFGCFNDIYFVTAVCLSTHAN